MVARVEGIVNGAPVIFKRVYGNQWETEVPASLNGVYVLEMTAYDEAGNIDHISKYLLMYDPVNLCASLVPCPYQAELVPDVWQASVTLSDYYAELIEPAQCCCGR